MERRERGREIVRWLIYNHLVETQRDLALSMGYNPTVLSAAMTGKIPFSDKLSRNLCKVNSQLNVEWLLTGEGEMLLPEEGKSGLTIEASSKAMSEPESVTPQQRWKPQVPLNRTRKKVKYYPNLSVSAGQVEQEGYDDEHEMMCLPGGKEAEAVFPVMGHSMEPFIYDGDMVGVVSMNSWETINPDRVYMVITRDNERMIKRIAPTRPSDECITLLSYNPDYKPFEVEKQNILKIMKVVFSGRNYD